MKIAIVVEGAGDTQSFPTLVAKTAAILGAEIFAPNPIPAKGYKNLQRPGQLERFVEMAASRQDCEAVVVCVDLDDDCAKKAHEEFSNRCEELSTRYGKEIRICFPVREYECWFLEDIENLKISAPEYGWKDDINFEDPAKIRGAKEALNASMNRHYKESSDQITLTRKLDIVSLAKRSRSFRKFAKSISGMNYDEIDAKLDIL